MRNGKMANSQEYARADAQVKMPSSLVRLMMRLMNCQGPTVRRTGMISVRAAMTGEVRRQKSEGRS